MRQHLWTSGYVFHNLLTPSGNDHPGTAVSALSQQRLLQGLSTTTSKEQEEEVWGCRQADLKAFGKIQQGAEKKVPGQKQTEKASSICKDGVQHWQQAKPSLWMGHFRERKQSHYVLDLFILISTLQKFSPDVKQWTYLKSMELQHLCQRWIWLPKDFSMQWFRQWAFKAYVAAIAWVEEKKGQKRLQQNSHLSYPSLELSSNSAEPSAQLWHKIRARNTGS